MSAIKIHYISELKFTITIRTNILTRANYNQSEIYDRRKNLSYDRRHFFKQNNFIFTRQIALPRFKAASTLLLILLIINSFEIFVPHLGVRNSYTLRKPMCGYIWVHLLFDNCFFM